MMEDLIKKWGGTNLYNIFSTNEFDFVHPDDWDNLNNYKYIRSLHKCLNFDGLYATLLFYDLEIRVKPSIFYPLNVIPIFNPCEEIKLISSKDKTEFGTVQGIHWHNTNNIFYYDIEVNGQMRSRRYYSEDLEKI